MSEAQQYYAPDEAAEFLRFKRGTMNVWRSQGRGPPYTKVGGRIRYLGNDLRRWIEADEEGRRALEQASQCHQKQSSRTPRLRGRAGAQQRARRLAAEPNCRDCAARGMTDVKASQVDHVIRITEGGADTDDNVRSLCTPCHKMRTSGQYDRWKAQEIWAGVPAHRRCFV